MKGQELKHRISGAKETVQITSAMQLISASKMTKTQRKLEQSRDFIREMKEVLSSLGKVSHPLVDKRDGGRTVYIVIAGDKGLCGDYNHAVLSYADDLISSTDTVNVYAVGQYTREHYNKLGVHVTNSYIHMMQEPFIEDAKAITEDLVTSFLKGEMDDVFVVYTAVPDWSLSKQEVVTRRILPVELPEQNTEGGCLENKNDIVGILKQYIWTRIYFALCCSSLAVNYKRMTAMQQSTANGKKLAAELQAKYNHIRQESITTELIDAGIAKQGRRI